MKYKCCILRSPTRTVPRSSVAGQDQFHMSQYSNHTESTEVLCNPSLFLTADVVERFLLITSRFSWKWRAVDRDSKTDAKSERPWVQCRYVGQGLVFCTWCKNEPIRWRHSGSTLNLLPLLSHCLRSSFTFLRTSSSMAVCTGQAVSLYTESSQILKAPAVVLFIAITRRSVSRIHKQLQHIIRNTVFKKLL